MDRVMTKSEALQLVADEERSLIMTPVDCVCDLKGCDICEGAGVLYEERKNDD
jgi:hypothetical protein